MPNLQIQLGRKDNVKIETQIAHLTNDIPDLTKSDYVLAIITTVLADERLLTIVNKRILKEEKDIETEEE